MGGQDVTKTSQVGSADPPIALRIEPLAPQHAHAAARLHMDGQAGTFLAALGPNVLEIVYEALPRAGSGFGFAAVTAAGADALEPVVGFVSAATSVGRLFLETGLTQASKLAPHLAARFVEKPALIGLAMQTALFPLLARGAGGEDGGSIAAANRAELLSIMVEESWRGRGAGAILLEVLLAECAARGVAHLDVTVDAANEGARRFYARHGFAFQRQFRIYGRVMCNYGRRV